MEDKEKKYVEELLNKLWTDEYPNDNEGISQSKMDLQHVRDYIDHLYYYSQLNNQLITALLDKVLNWTDPFERVCLSINEISNNHSTYMVEYDENNNAVIYKDWSCGSDGKNY